MISFMSSHAEQGIRAWSVTAPHTCSLCFSSRRRHTRLVSDWSSDQSRMPSSAWSELQSLTNLVCRLLLGQKEESVLESDVEEDDIKIRTGNASSIEMCYIYVSV